MPNKESNINATKIEEKTRYISIAYGYIAIQEISLVPGVAYGRLHGDLHMDERSIREPESTWTGGKIHSTLEIIVYTTYYAFIKQFPGKFVPPLGQGHSPV